MVFQEQQKTFITQCLSGVDSSDRVEILPKLGGTTQVKLAELTGIPQRHISEMEHGKRPIGKEIAKRLGKVLNIRYRVFL